MKKSKKRNTIMLLILLVCGITVGFALLSTTLYINGSGIVKGNKWDIHWENVANEDGVDAQTPIIDSNKTTVTYEINLVNPGDFYSFTVDAVNAGTLDGVINSIENKFYESDGETEIDLPSYLSYSITYDDGSSIEKGQRLDANQSKTYKVKVKYRTDVDSSELPTTNKTIISKFSVEYVQADVEVNAKSFAKDDWGTIADCAKLGTCPYEVGDTKTIEMDIDGDGTKEEYTLRIANMSTPSECNTPGFSQTACGFVVEFQDIVTNYRMNSYAGVYPPQGVGDGNKGGWEYSDMRAYLNNGVYTLENINYANTGFFSKLPADLKKVIIDTYVVTGKGWGENSSASGVSRVKDKVYLLSGKELFGADLMNEEESNKTRQLDYYINQNTSKENYAPCVKNYQTNPSSWWLRANVPSPMQFILINDVGGWPAENANSVFGVSPAFRIE